MVLLQPLSFVLLSELVVVPMIDKVANLGSVVTAKPSPCNKVLVMSQSKKSYKKKPKKKVRKRRGNSFNRGAMVWFIWI